MNAANKMQTNSSPACCAVRYRNIWQLSSHPDAPQNTMWEAVITLERREMGSYFIACNQISEI